MIDRILDELRDVVGPRHVVTDGGVRRSHEVDWTGRFVGATPAVIRPCSGAEVADVVRVCRRAGQPLVAQGGNTGLVGGNVPTAGALVLDLRRLQRLDSVDTMARQVTVGAGVTIEAVQQAAAAAGLRYAVDFGARATATIGGSIATNAGGVNVLRHGSTRHQLLGVEAVLGTGDVVSRLHGLEKDNTGYDIAGLLCGSEGTLGIVTAARVRLVTAHPSTVTALVGFSGVGAAVEAVSVWRSSIDDLEAAELMLGDGIDLVCRAFGLPQPFARRWPAVVLLESGGHDDPTPRLAAALDAASGAGEVVVATDSVRRRALWRYRDDHTPAIATVGVPHKFDVTVPVPRIEDFVGSVTGLIQRRAPGATTWLFGHIGDGNLHVNVTGHAADAYDLDEAVYRLVIDHGGCISAEHGIGRAKARWLGLDRTSGELAAMRAIKRAWDPDGILNPGAVLPPTV